MTKEEKLNYLLEHYMTATDVTRAFGFRSNTMISNMRKGQTNIATLHIEGLEKHFNIPQKVFSSEVTSTKEIDLLIKEYQEEKKEKERQKELQKKILKKLEETNLNKFSNQIFPTNQKLFNKLKGVWYGYVYPSNPASAEHGIWEVETTIYDDYSVVDYWGNAGYLKTGKNESLIIKESYDHDDLTIIRFSNRQVPSGIFRFVVVSNQNHTLNEMVNFGFFSRQRYDLEEAKEILGSIESKQLKLDLEFNKRLIERAIVPQ